MSQSKNERGLAMAIVMATLSLCACATSRRDATVAAPPSEVVVTASIDTTKPIPLIGAYVPAEAAADGGIPPLPNPQPGDAAVPR